MPSSSVAVYRYLEEIIARNRVSNSIKRNQNSGKESVAETKKCSESAIDSQPITEVSTYLEPVCAMDETATVPSTSYSIPSIPFASAVCAPGTVKLRLSNLPTAFTAEYLKVVFSRYSVDSIVIHFGENETHLGTGEVVMSKESAEKALADYKDLAKYGCPILMEIVEGDVIESIVDQPVKDNQSLSPPRAPSPVKQIKMASIFDRVELVKKVAGGVQKRSPVPSKQKILKKSVGGAQKKLADFLANPEVAKSSKMKIYTREVVFAEIDEYLKMDLEDLD